MPLLDRALFALAALGGVGRSTFVLRAPLKQSGDTWPAIACASHAHRRPVVSLRVPSCE